MAEVKADSVRCAESGFVVQPHALVEDLASRAEAASQPASDGGVRITEGERDAMVDHASQRLESVVRRFGPVLAADDPRFQACKSGASPSSVRARAKALVDAVVPESE